MTKHLEWSFVLSAGWGSWAVAGLLVGAVAIVIWTVVGYRREPWPRIVTLGLLRALSATVLCLLVLRLAVRLEVLRDAPGTVVVLADASASMRAPVTPDTDETRLQRARRILAPSGPTLRRLSESHRIEPFVFGRDIEAVEPSGLAEALDGRRSDTRIVESVVSAAKRVGRSLGGVVVVTDGADRGRLAERGLSKRLRRELRGLGAPVHLALVAATPLPDIGLGAVRAAPVSFVRAETEVDVEVVARRMDVDRVPVTLVEDGRVLAEEEVRFGTGESKKNVVLRFRPRRVGPHVYRIAVPAYEGDRVRENDSRDILVNVRRDKMRVLHVAGHPSWDVRFLRQLLRRDATVDLVSFFILRSITDLPLSSSEELSLIPFPANELFTEHLPSFDLVVFQDFDPEPYGVAPHLDRLARWVKNGGAFVLVGGDVGFSRFAGTPLEEVLPVAPQVAPGVPEGDTGEYVARLTAEGLRHPVTRLVGSAEDNAAEWNALVPLEGIGLVRAAKAEALTLLVHPFLRAATGPAPVLAVTEPGEGRAMALMTDASWLWAFEQAGKGRSTRAYETLWHNAFRWLLKDPELDRLRVTTDRDRLVSGESVAIDALALDRDFRPVPADPISIEVLPADGGEAVARREGSTDEAGSFHFEVVMERAGAYRVVAEAELPERPGQAGERRTATHPFLVEGAGDEMGDLAPDVEKLEDLAAATGGRLVTVGDADALPDLDLRSPEVRLVERSRDVEIWRHPVALALVVGLLATEWGLRRRLGYR